MPRHRCHNEEQRQHLRSYSLSVANKQDGTALKRLFNAELPEMISSGAGRENSVLTPLYILSRGRFELVTTTWAIFLKIHPAGLRRVIPHVVELPHYETEPRQEFRGEM